MALTPTARAPILTCCAAVLAFPFAASADYSWQVAGLVDHAEDESGVRLSDGGNQVGSDVLSLSAAYYFDPVNDETNPRALAAFFDPASQVSISRHEDTYRLERISSGIADLEIVERDYVVSGTYLLPRSKWYAGGLYSQGDVDNGPLDPSSTEGYGMVTGKYLGAGSTTRLELALGRTTTDSEDALGPCTLPSCIIRTETIEDTVSLDVMHVLRYPSATYTIFGGVSQRSTDNVLFYGSGTGAPPRPPGEINLEERRAYSIGTELFVVGQVGLRLGYTRFDGTTSEDDSIELGASWFFRGAVGLELTVARDGSRPPSSLCCRLPSLPVHTDRAALRVIGRF